MTKLKEKEICDKWLENKTINPETSRKIKENGPTYKKLNKLCSLNPLNQIKEIKAATKIKDKKDLIEKLTKEKKRRLAAIEALKERLKLEQEALKRYLDNPKKLAKMQIQIQKTLKQIQIYSKQLKFLTESFINYGTNILPPMGKVIP